jgi:hypothetical protein
MSGTGRELIGCDVDDYAVNHRVRTLEEAGKRVDN